MSINISISQMRKRRLREVGEFCVQGHTGRGEKGLLNVLTNVL